MPSGYQSIQKIDIKATIYTLHTHWYLIYKYFTLWKIVGFEMKIQPIQLQLMAKWHQNLNLMAVHETKMLIKQSTKAKKHFKLPRNKNYKIKNSIQLLFYFYSSG